MKLVTPSLIIEDSDGFKNDALQRQSFGEALSNMVVRSTDELVISLDGKWGEGKTTFVKMWQGLLQEKGIPSIYIDAFQNDYTEDAFISIASAITSYVALNSDKEDKAIEFKDKAKKVGVRLLAWTAKVGVKAATLGIINESDIGMLSEINEDIATSTSETIEELVNKRLTTHSKENEIISSFRNSLANIPLSLKENKSGRLVIIIDELDRCKPSFAIEILEKIKHLFSVSNVAFLLVMNKDQLEESIRCVYGAKIDAHTYLQKFINIETSIPKRVAGQYNNDLESYITRLIKLHEIETWGDDRYIFDCLKVLAKHFNLSLRQLEKIFTNIAIIYSTSNEYQLRLVPIITFISTIKVDKPITFKKLSLGKITYQELCEEISLPHLDEKNRDDRQLSLIMSWIRYSILSEEEYEKLDQNDKTLGHQNSLLQYNIDRRNLIFFFCEKLNIFRVN